MEFLWSFLNINIEFCIWKLVDIGKCEWKYLYIWMQQKSVVCTINEQT